MATYPTTLMLLGSGELGKEIVIAAKRLGCKVIACDRYANAPAMQIADKAEVFDMTNSAELKKAILHHQPDLVIPEIEALAVEALAELESQGITIIPTARATAVTMNRDQIRNLAANTLGVQTARFAYASNAAELQNAAIPLGWPVIVKPVMSSSGKGQSLVKTPEGLPEAWNKAIKGSRGKSKQVIVEEFIDFDFEITLLTIRQKNGDTIFCKPIGHQQVQGDYQCSWQPAKIDLKQLKKAQEMARHITNNLGGRGLFGVEFFIRGEEVIFSELSPRPHDTGLVTIMSQNLNEFELHLRAILGIPIPEITTVQASASRVILATHNYSSVAYEGIEKALSEANTKVLIFGKPNAKPGRRMGVALAQGENIEEAQNKADKAAAAIQIKENNLSTN